MGTQLPLVAIVDDEPEVLRGLRRLLRTEGFDVATYCSAEEFIGSLGSSHLDCLVLDLHMPGMTGFDVLEALAAVPDQSTRPPVVVLTGNDTAASRARAQGASAFLTKPADADILIPAIRNAMSRRAVVASTQ